MGRSRNTRPYRATGRARYFIRVINFTENGKRFNYRVVGVALHSEHVLLHRSERDDFWALPGGRGELLEPSPDTLRREMREELAADVEVRRLLWVVENFFRHDETDYHELSLYFLMDFLEASSLYRAEEFMGQEGDLKLIFRWFPLDELCTLALYPSFLKKGLLELPHTPAHLIHHD